MKYNITQYTTIIFALFLTTVISAQSVEVQGDLKVANMEQDNTNSTLVTRKSDGTLATRDAKTLKRSNFSQDTSRTLGTDMKLASHLCNCETIPPFMVESMMDAGYSVSDLIKAGVDSDDLIKAGVTFEELFSNGKSLNDLKNEGVPLQTLLSLDNVTVEDLLALGYLTSAFVGLEYQGGIIFQCFSNGTGKIINKYDLGEYEWGCYFNPIGALAQSVGDGEQNTAAIIAGCADTPIAATVCNDLVIDGYDDWYLPAINEFIFAYDAVGPGATGSKYNKINLTHGIQYYSSSEVSAATNEAYFYPWGGTQHTLKLLSLQVRAVRKFQP